jgi:hypothetical protein
MIYLKYRKYKSFFEFCEKKLHDQTEEKNADVTYKSCNSVISNPFDY